MASNQPNTNSNPHENGRNDQLNPYITGQTEGIQDIFRIYDLQPIKDTNQIRGIQDIFREYDLQPINDTGQTQEIQDIFRKHDVQPIKNSDQNQEIQDIFRTYDLHPIIETDEDANSNDNNDYTMHQAAHPEPNIPSKKLRLTKDIKTTCFTSHTFTEYWCHGDNREANWKETYTQEMIEQKINHEPFLKYLNSKGVYVAFHVPTNESVLQTMVSHPFDNDALLLVSPTEVHLQSNSRCRTGESPPMFLYVPANMIIKMESCLPGLHVVVNPATVLQAGNWNKIIFHIFNLHRQEIIIQANSPLVKFSFTTAEQQVSCTAQREKMEIQCGQKIVKIMTITTIATFPERVNTGDAGYALYGLHTIIIKPHQRRIVHTGLKMELPEGLIGQICKHSGQSLDSDIETFVNIIDANHREEVTVTLFNTGIKDIIIVGGQRVAQIVFQSVENPEFMEVDHLNEPERGPHSFGSTETTPSSSRTVSPGWT